MTKVALLNINTRIPHCETEALADALTLIGGINDINTFKNPVTIKVGVFDHKAFNHASVDMVRAIINVFDKAPKIYLAESDNYHGTALERLQIYRSLFNERVNPVNLSTDSHTQRVKIAGKEMGLSHYLFEPHILVDTHIIRTYARGSVLKNLLGCVPEIEKAQYHDNDILFDVLSDIFAAVSGIDFAVLDGTYFHRGAGGSKVKTDIMISGKDAVAVETVGAQLAGLTPKTMEVIQKFAKKGYGEGDITTIEIVGDSYNAIKKKFEIAAVELHHC